jgi:hypothetical protein
MYCNTGWWGGKAGPHELKKQVPKNIIGPVMNDSRPDKKTKRKEQAGAEIRTRVGGSTIL